MDYQKISKNWDSALLNFAHSLIPSYIKKGKAALYPVLETLKTEQKDYLIDRICMSGSIGKHTSLEDSDFDCILLINDLSPPYKQVLDCFKKILEEELTTLKISSKIKTTEYSLQFDLGGEYKVDLLVAANYAHNLGRAEMFKKQRIVVWGKIERNPDEFYVYSTALAETQVDFMKKQDSLTHSFVRLCKYWLKSLDLERYRSGVKSAIELIAVWSAHGRKARKNQSMTSAFRVFLIHVSKLSDLKIIFKTDGKPLRKIRKKLMSPSSRIRQMSIPENILKKNNFIVDPANPWNDLTEDISPEVQTKLQNYAAVARSKFDSMYSRVHPDLISEELVRTFIETCCK